ncbi:unnamed protein product [Toxocara canis]|uniref:J domain-containing protein n=1 Tax=Toxocara canis TaxID=6265 RepID=A0A183VBK8_TOXCA|nr:unnamed protein product [Toxocara canis]
MMAQGLTTVNDYNKTSVKAFFDVYGSYFGNQVNNIFDLLLAAYKPPLLTDNNHIGWLQTKSNIFSAAGFTSFIALEASWYLQDNNTHVFLYDFDYVSAVGRIYDVPGWNPVPHTAELPFVWMQKPIWQKAIDSRDVIPTDYEMADFFGEAWTTFAKTGFKCDANQICPPWLPTVLDGNNLRYLAINAPKMMMPNYRPIDRITFNRILPTIEKQWIAAAAAADGGHPIGILFVRERIKVSMMKVVHIYFMFLVYTIFDVVLCNEDPYVTLGLSRKATVREIKRAYKNLAKEWHPDKNDSPKAHEKFMAITRAYETLSDPLKKERYDKYGTFDEPPTEGYRHAAHHFEEFFGFGFGGFDNGNSYFQKHRISMRMFSHSLLEKSFSQPLIVFAYSGYCQLCFRLEPIWQSVVEDLEPLGYGVGTVNAITDGNLLEKLRVSRLPSIVVVVEGRVIHYRGSMHPLSAKSVRIFARDVIPNTFLLKINNHDGLRRFIDQWKSYNKISVLIFGAKEDPRIRYVLTAMKYATFARFAYIHLNENNEEVLKMREALGIQCVNCENMLIFNDFPEKGPVARLSVGNGKQLSIEAIDALIESNKHLIFPRVSL